MSVATPTPSYEPPYYAVIFTSVRYDDDHEAYAAAANRMLALADTFSVHIAQVERSYRFPQPAPCAGE